MQHLNLNIINVAKKARLKQLEEGLILCMNSERVDCPFCHYVSKNKQFSGKIFVNGNDRSFKCFACGIWRKL